MYIGKSENVHGRWKSHSKSAPLHHPVYSSYNKVVDLYTIEVEIEGHKKGLQHFIPISILPDVKLRGELIALTERILIDHFDAELNTPTDRKRKVPIPNILRGALDDVTLTGDNETITYTTPNNAINFLRPDEKRKLPTVLYDWWKN